MVDFLAGWLWGVVSVWLVASLTLPPRRRGSNPPPPGRKPTPAPLNPPHMAECGGPCWEAQDPRCCDCGALWRDVPIRMDEGRVQRGGLGDGPTTPKPPIKPQPHGGRQLPNVFP
jgi:hypothetical protein